MKPILLNTKKLLFLAATSLLFPAQASAYKEPATLMNTAIISLILLPPLALFCFFRVQKSQMGRKNRGILEELAAAELQFDPDTVGIVVRETLGAVLHATQTGDRGALKGRLTPEFRGRYERESAFFDDYESLSFEMILTVDRVSRCVEAVVTCGRISRKNTRTPSVEEAWKFVESSGGWFLDSVREVEMSEYVEL